MMGKKFARAENSLNIFFFEGSREFISYPKDKDLVDKIQLDSDCHKNPYSH